MITIFWIDCSFYFLLNKIFTCFSCYFFISLQLLHKNLYIYTLVLLKILIILKMNSSYHSIYFCWYNLNGFFLTPILPCWGIVFLLERHNLRAKFSTDNRNRNECGEMKAPSGSQSRIGCQIGFYIIFLELVKYPVTFPVLF